MVEVLWAYWLLWFVLPNGPKDGLNAYVFPLAILLAKGEDLASSIVPGGSTSGDPCGLEVSSYIHLGAALDGDS